ncbi:peptidase, M16 family [Paenibacillus sp. JCM 10914]|nr:peptidase, M16 family [Paenibacillus sp. JCM 10914]
MDSHYTIENTVIALAGNITEEVVELLERHFGGFANHGASAALTPPAFLDGLQFRKKKTEQNHICMSFPGCSIGDELQYAMVLLNNAIGGGMSSRLFQEIREKRGLAYSVYSYHSSNADNGMFTIYAGTAPKQTKEVLELTTEMMRDLAVNGMSEEEIRKGKEQLKGSLILSLESTSSRMNRLGKNELMLGRHYSLDEIIERIEQVEMKDVDAVLDRMFGTPYALAMVGTSDKALNVLRRNEFVALRSNQ